MDKAFKLRVQNIVNEIKLDEGSNYEDSDDNDTGTLTVTGAVYRLLKLPYNILTMKLEE